MPAPLTAKFALQGPGGNFFGEEITIEFRIVKKLDEMEHVVATCELSDHGEITFEEAFIALKAASGCKPWALELIKKAKEQVKEDPTSNDIMMFQ